MKIHPTLDQQAFIRDAIDAGRLGSVEEAVEEALALWEANERRRAEILGAVGQARISVAQGRGRVITKESMRNLADEIHQRGLARLAAEQKVPR